MGTTCSALVLLPHGAVVGHVGDSRVYRLRRNQLEQLTFDHSLVWEMRAAGFSSDGDMKDPPKNIITRSLGPNPHVEADLEGPFPLEVGDRFLLCSDGLTGEVGDEEIGVILGCLPPDEAVRVLVDLANLRGGGDNVTAIAAQVTGPELIDASPAPMLERRSQPAKSAGNPALWFAVFALGVAAGVVAWIASINEMMIQAVAAGTIAVAGIVVGSMRLFAKPAEAARPVAPGQYGHGPHTARDCTANRRVVDTLSEIVSELQDAATEEKWKVDWNNFNVLTRAASEATKVHDFSTASAHLCRAISFMMSQLRTQPRGV
jgi:protein phosphatase